MHHFAVSTCMAASTVQFYKKTEILSLVGTPDLARCGLQLQIKLVLEAVNLYYYKKVQFERLIWTASNSQECDRSLKGRTPVIIDTHFVPCLTARSH